MIEHSTPRLLDDEALSRSSVVANSAMNRERGLEGGNSYAKELGLDVLGFLRERLREGGRVAWLDLCCGSGKALVEAGERLCVGTAAADILGVDLVPMFVRVPPELSCVTLREADLRSWHPERRYDLVTCVHGLHYVGDKLGLVARALGWLEDDGVFAASFDSNAIRYADGKPVTRRIAAVLRRAGCDYNARRHVLIARGRREIDWDLEYVGADEKAGPNYTGQPAVHSYYVVK
jgi:SAM-dependent methyltransferase